MPCGKRPLVKKWDHPRNIPKITPSKYEQNEASVKVHWRNVIKELELSYKDDKFWETQSELVGSLVGPTVFRRLAKIFQLSIADTTYEPRLDIIEEIPSELFYTEQLRTESRMNPRVSVLSMGYTDTYDEELEEEEMEEASTTTTATLRTFSKSKSGIKAISQTKNKSYSRSLSKQINKSSTLRSRLGVSILSIDSDASSGDDLVVHPATRVSARPRSKAKRVKNPHFDMLYCNESETDMIKWNSKYKQKTFEVSASDEFSKKAEIMTKKISKEFYDWWTGIGTPEYKSEIKRHEDIEDLFQVWFDEHASRGLVLDPRILPCVLRSIANYVKVPKAACPKVLKRQIAYDIHAETSPAHTMAFNTCLPQKMKHIPPKNNTKSAWQSLKIPEDLRSMACVWDEIKHLTSTKVFQQYLEQHPHLPTPPCLRPQTDDADKKQRFVVPSDFVVRDGSVSSAGNDMALPVSQFTMELKEILEKVMND